MISASSWSSRWAAGTAALLLAGGSALPGDVLDPAEPDPAPAVDVPTEDTHLAEDPTEEAGPPDEDPTDPSVDEPSAPEPPAVDAPTGAPPAEDVPGEDAPAEDAPAEDLPTEDLPTEDLPEADEPEQSGPTLVVLSEPVTVVVDGAPGYLLPLGDGGFTWLVDGVRVDELGAAARLVESPDGSWYELSAGALGTDVERIVLAVVAIPGHALISPDGTTSLLRVVLDPRRVAELVVPTALDGEAREDAVVVPDVPTQVVRDATGEVLDTGTHPVTAEYVDGVATVALTVSAADGFRLEVDGTPVETLPGAGGTSEVVLELTDVPPAQPVPSPEETPAGSPSAPVAPAREEDPEQRPELAAPLVTVPVASPATPEPAVAVAAETVPAQPDALEQLPESGPEGLGLMVMLGGLLLGGSWLVLGMRGE